jgi:flagellar motor switch protein FliN/FliY
MSDEIENQQADDGSDQAMADSTEQNSNQRDDVQPAKMDELSGTAAAVSGAPDLDVIMDIPVSISMEVGNTEISIRNLLQLNQGSVIELDRLAGEPLDVLVNGTLIAHGEVVVVNDKFGIRMTDVISPSERIKKLR